MNSALSSWCKPFLISPFSHGDNWELGRTCFSGVLSLVWKSTTPFLVGCFVWTADVCRGGDLRQLLFPFLRSPTKHLCFNKNWGEGGEMLGLEKIMYYLFLNKRLLYGEWILSLFRCCEATERSVGRVVQYWIKCAFKKNRNFKSLMLLVKW